MAPGPTFFWACPIIGAAPVAMAAASQQTLTSNQLPNFPPGQIIALVEVTPFIHICSTTWNLTPDTKSLFRVRINLDGLNEPNLSYSRRDTQVTESQALHRGQNDHFLTHTYIKKIRSISKNNKN